MDDKTGPGPVTLRSLGVGNSGRVTAVLGRGALRRHLLDMGITPGTTLTVTKAAPLGDPIEIRLRGYALTIRLGDAENILVELEG